MTPAEPTEAVMYIQGQEYFGILFYYNQCLGRQPSPFKRGVPGR